ncbi:hypothetical protein HanXRQr2_Chr09g0383541 [Helianthus annuus]|uniref:Uncharacterized protein n=1 Tax=Helianthus annuus TaxID=4232 RepID=A0A9K3N8M8_HELAN|nr:hypothetical protein HanXRQr2_Chr09g0383541 [Helianthus annuus]
MAMGWEQKIESSSMLFTNFAEYAQVWKNELDSGKPMELMLSATNLQQVKGVK